MNRPPLTKGELTAYNAGRRLMWDAAEEVSHLTAGGIVPVSFLDQDETGALVALGERGWWFWFWRGWWAAEEDQA